MDVAVNSLETCIPLGEERNIETAELSQLLFSFSCSQNNRPTGVFLSWSLEGIQDETKLRHTQNTRPAVYTAFLPGLDCLFCVSSWDCLRRYIAPPFKKVPAASCCRDDCRGRSCKSAEILLFTPLQNNSCLISCSMMGLSLMGLEFLSGRGLRTGQTAALRCGDGLSPHLGIEA